MADKALILHPEARVQPTEFPMEQSTYLVQGIADFIVTELDIQKASGR
jgi:hypothetical protein